MRSNRIECYIDYSTLKEHDTLKLLDLCKQRLNGHITAYEYALKASQLTGVDLTPLVNFHLEVDRRRLEKENREAEKKREGRNVKEL